jgi:hypothetical protein
MSLSRSLGDTRRRAHRNALLREGEERATLPPTIPTMA